MALPDTLSRNPASALLGRHEIGATLSDISEVLAHRLRNLVAGIEGYTDLLAFSLESTDERDLALRIMHGAAKINRIIDDLLLFSHAPEPSPLPMNPSTLVADFLYSLDAADLARVDYRIDVPEGLSVLADPQQIRQALLIVMQNALEASGREGAVGVRVYAPEPGFLGVDVRNAGCMPFEDAETLIFKPFFTTKSENLGVGLPIARRIVEAHGGTVYLSANTPEAGTCITFMLPTAGEESALF